MSDVEVDGVREYSAENLRQCLFTSSTKRRVAELRTINEKLARKGMSGDHWVSQHNHLTQAYRDIHHSTIHDNRVIAWYICILRRQALEIRRSTVYIHSS